MQRGFGFIPVILLITLMVITASVFYLIGRNSSSTKVESTVQPSASVLTIVKDTLPTPIPTAAWRTFEVEKADEVWRSFTISYPEFWSISKESHEMPKGVVVTLSKGSNKIVITQGSGDGSECLFNAENKSGQSAHFTSNKEIQHTDAVWRRSQLMDQSNGSNRYDVCSKRIGQNFFTTITHIGWISIDIPGNDNEVLKEVDQILEKITF
jgi:hypothetical protein